MDDLLVAISPQRESAREQNQTPLAYIRFLWWLAFICTIFALATSSWAVINSLDYQSTLFWATAIPWLFILSGLVAIATNSSRLQSLLLPARDIGSTPIPVEDQAVMLQEDSLHMAEVQTSSNFDMRPNELFPISTTSVDPLTGLLGRAALFEYIEQALQRSKRYPEYKFALLYLDLDDFKTVVDSMGIHAGDQLLMFTAKRLNSCMREVDLVTRLDGDEFAVVISDVADAAEAITAAKRALNELKMPFVLSGDKYFMSASLGLVVADLSYHHPDEVLRDAGLALGVAKLKGKSRFEIFQAVHFNETADHLDFDNQNQNHLPGKELLLLFQPLATLESSNILGVEAILCWDHPKYGLISPERYIPAAEADDPGCQLMEWMLRKTCRQIKEWQDRFGLDDFFLSITLSPSLLGSAQFFEKVHIILREYKLAAGRLNLEIADSAYGEKPAGQPGALEIWRQSGIQVHRLRSTNFNIFQRRWISKPVSADEISVMLEKIHVSHLPRLVRRTRIAPLPDPTRISIN